MAAASATTAVTQATRAPTIRPPRSSGTGPPTAHVAAEVGVGELEHHAVGVPWVQEEVSAVDVDAGDGDAGRPQAGVGAPHVVDLPRQRVQARAPTPEVAVHVAVVAPGRQEQQWVAAVPHHPGVGALLGPHVVDRRLGRGGLVGRLVRDRDAGHVGRAEQAVPPRRRGVGVLHRHGQAVHRPCFDQSHRSPSSAPTCRRIRSKPRPSVETRAPRADVAPSIWGTRWPKPTRRTGRRRRTPWASRTRPWVSTTW